MNSTTYEIPEPRGGWKTDFTDAEKAKLRPIAETLAMLDGNAFFGVDDSDDREWYEQYLPEAHALYEANGGDRGWAGRASFVQSPLPQRATDASDMLRALTEERDSLYRRLELTKATLRMLLKEARAALEPFTTPPLYVLEDDARFVPEKMPDGWIGGGWFSSKDFRRAITAYYKIAHAALKEGRDE